MNAIIFVFALFKVPHTHGEFLEFGSLKSPWTFSAMRYDETLHLYHFLHRDYDSSTGTFLTTDPAGFKDGPNLYAYVHNNPLTYVDPYGLFATSLYNSMTDQVSNVFRSPRFQGACQMLAGAAEMSAGGLIAYGTGALAAPVGLSVAVHGSDHFATGLNTFISGRYNNTITSQMLEKTGLSTVTANTIDNTISIIGTMGAAALHKSTQQFLSPQHKVPLTALAQTTPATSSYSGHSLKNKLIAQEISGGHAFEKHVLNQGEFRGWIRTKNQLAKHIENVLNNPSAVRQLVRNRTAYWHQETGTLVIRSPRAYDGGTVYQPKKGYEHFFKDID